MLRSAATAANLLRCASAASSTAPAATSIAGVRSFAMGGVPEHWGKPSEYTEGTNFLGTPKDHLELVAKRPLSPDVFTLDNKGFHYKMPWGAVSSIANRATGVALSVGFAGAGYVALTGDLPGALAALKANYPVTTFFCKAAITFPLVYHFAGGMRHVVWDQHKIGKQADHHSLLETPAVEKSSQAILAGSAALALILAML